MLPSSSSSSSSVAVKSPVSLDTIVLCSHGGLFLEFRKVPVIISGGFGAEFRDLLCGLLFTLIGTCSFCEPDEPSKKDGPGGVKYFIACVGKASLLCSRNGYISNWILA